MDQQRGGHRLSTKVTGNRMLSTLGRLDLRKAQRTRGSSSIAGPDSNCNGCCLVVQTLNAGAHPQDIVSASVLSSACDRRHPSRAARCMATLEDF